MEEIEFDWSDANWLATAKSGVDECTGACEG